MVTILYYVEKPGPQLIIETLKLFQDPTVGLPDSYTFEINWCRVYSKEFVRGINIKGHLGTLT